MAKIEDCPGFETFGADVKAARKAKQLSRSALADMIHCDSRYLANIENEGTLPSLPVVIQLIRICGLPVERYFNPELMREESAERQQSVRNTPGKETLAGAYTAPEKQS